MAKHTHITKTDFVRFLKCPLYAWLWKNRPDLRKGHHNSKVADQGYEVERIAQGLFERGDEVQGNYKEAKEHTLKLMEDGSIVIYQATALTHHYLARSDILKRDKSGRGWHLFEVKSSTKIKPEHYADLCFQLYAFKQAGIELTSIHLILIDSDYVYHEKKGLEVKKFLKSVDLTEEITQKLNEFEPLIEEAYKTLTSNIEPKVIALKKNFEYGLPEKFEKYYRRNIANYSIYDISNIRNGSLLKLSKMKAKFITDIPDDYFSSKSKNVQVRLTKQKSQSIDEPAIRDSLDQLEYPLYFLDYETINPAVPMVDKTHPYQQVPFQYSLHVIDKPKAEIKHVDFLHSEKSNPVPHLLKALKTDIGDSGSVIVWYKRFESSRNKEMGEMCPEYQAFMQNLNDRIYDLMEIFKDSYLDYRFKGSASIKNVLPVLVPELSYKELEIQHGTMAMDGILDLIEGNTDDKEKLINDLKEYCALDTMAMVKIFEFLQNL